MAPSDDYISFDEIGDVLASVELISSLAPTLVEQSIRLEVGHPGCSQRNARRDGLRLCR